MSPTCKICISIFPFSHQFAPLPHPTENTFQDWTLSNHFLLSSLTINPPNLLNSNISYNQTLPTPPIATIFKFSRSPPVTLPPNLLFLKQILLVHHNATGSHHSLCLNEN